MEGAPVIKDGDQVMLKKENKIRLFQVNKTRDIMLDKVKFSLAGVIGHPFGTLFEVKDGQMVKMDREMDQKNDEASCEGKDNRDLQDLDSNQKLTQETIEQMKREGVSGSDLINQLIENSTTFQTKTGYAQEKWVKKKKKKHLLQYSVLKPNSRLMCELQWSKGPSRICNLRVDSLSQILTCGNVRAGSTVMVVDSCLGLVTGAVLERLGGYGKVISLYSSDNPINTQLVGYDFSEDIMNTLLEFPLEMVNSLKHQLRTNVDQNTDGTIQDRASMQTDVPATAANSNSDAAIPSCSESKKDQGNDSSSKIDTDNIKSERMDVSETSVKTEQGTSEKEVKAESVLIEVKLESSEKQDNSDPSESSAQLSKDATDTDPDTANNGTNKDDGNDNVDPAVDNSENIKGETGSSRKKLPKSLNKKRLREERRATRQQNWALCRDILKLGTIDCLIVATKFHPTTITLALIDFLAPSRQVVVYSQFQEALKDCYVYLREHKGLVNYRLTETWMREYQVLPNRTHPVIQMTGTGGYLLTATTILQDQGTKK